MATVITFKPPFESYGTKHAKSCIMFGLEPTKSFMSVFSSLWKMLPGALSRPIFTSNIQVSQCVSVHIYLCRVSTGQQASHTPSPGAWRVSGLSTGQPALQKHNLFRLEATLKTGHSSITITLIRRETKAQHSHKRQTMQEIVNRGLNQNFSYMLKLVAHDSISRNKL